MYLPKGLVEQVSFPRLKSRPRSAWLAPEGWSQALPIHHLGDLGLGVTTGGD